MRSANLPHHPMLVPTSARALSLFLLLAPMTLLTGCPEPYPDPGNNHSSSPPPGVTNLRITSSPSGGTLYVGETGNGPWAPAERTTPTDMQLNWNAPGTGGITTLWFRVKFSDGRWSGPKSVSKGQSTITLSFTPQADSGSGTGTGSGTPSAGNLDVQDAWTSEDP